MVEIPIWVQWLVVSDPKSGIRSLLRKDLTWYFMDLSKKKFICHLTDLFQDTLSQVMSSPFKILHDLESCI